MGSTEEVEEAVRLASGENCTARILAVQMVKWYGQSFGRAWMEKYGEDMNI